MSKSNSTSQPVSYRDALLQSSFKEMQGLGDWNPVRKKSYERFLNEGFPNRKMEGWKYLHLDSVLNTIFLKPSLKPEIQSELVHAIQHYLGQTDVHSHLVFLNGIYAEDLSSNRLPDGAFAMRFSDALKKMPEWIQTSHLRSFEKLKLNPFADINAFKSDSSFVLYVPRGVKIEEPIHLLFAAVEGSTSPFVFYPRIFIALEEGAVANLVINHVGLTTQPFFVNGVKEILLSKSSKLNVCFLQQGGVNAFQLASTRASLSESSSLKWTSFAHACGTVRNEMQVLFEGENAQCALSGLSLLSGKTQVFHHASCEHSAKACKSEQLYKNILSGESLAEFNSLVHVTANGVGADSYQLNRNLLLSEGSRAFSRPQLKIYADDVKCSHGSATGQLDEDELFYLRSRGFSRELAKYMITYGFAEEVIAGIEPLSLRLQLERLIENELRSMTRNL